MMMWLGGTISPFSDWEGVITVTILMAAAWIMDGWSLTSPPISQMRTSPEPEAWCLQIHHHSHHKITSWLRDRSWPPEWQEDVSHMSFTEHTRQWPSYAISRRGYARTHQTETHSFHQMVADKRNQWHFPIPSQLFISPLLHCLLGSVLIIISDVTLMIEWLSAVSPGVLFSLLTLTPRLRYQTVEKSVSIISIFQSELPEGVNTS